MRLLVLAPYPPGEAPSQRYRFEQYLTRLREDGIDVTIRPLWSPELYRVLHRPGHRARKAWGVARGWRARRRDLRTAREADVVLVHREAFPIGGPWVEAAVVGGGTPMVYDFDDAIYLPSVSPANRWAGTLKSTGKVADIVAMSTVTLVGNRHLAEFARRHGSDVRVLPSVIDTDAYRCPPAPPTGPPTLGWTGSGTTLPHLRTLEAVIGRVQRRTGCRVRIIGVPDYRPDRFEAEVLPWSSASEVRDLCAVDVGLMPLPPTPWARGKCGMKLLQYMALGKAAVASPVGANEEIVRDGVNGLLADTDERWESTLVRLLEGPDLRARLGESARRTVEDRYSVDATYGDFRRALEDAMERRGVRPSREATP